MKTVSFVIPSYRSGATLPGTLDSIYAQRTSRPFQVIVVDSSDDGSRDSIGGRYPRAVVVSSDRRLPPAAARNRGAALSSGDYLAFVDADVVLESDWLEGLLAELEQSGARLAGGAVSNANPESRASRILHWIEFSEFLPGPSRDCRALSSSNLLLRRADFDAVGGFDPAWAMAEDLVFCSKLKGGVRFCGLTGIAHRHRSDWSEVLLHLERLGYWSGRLRLEGSASGSWLKHLPAASWLLIPWRSGKILARVLRADVSRGWRCLADLPALVGGLRSWTRGFRNGLKRGAEP